MSKQKDQCLFCNSRCCYERIASLEDQGKTYDQIACRKHVDDLYRHAYGGKDKVRMCKMSSTGKMSRGEAFEVPEGFLQKTEPKVTVIVDENVTEEQLEGVCKDLEQITALKGVPPQDAVLYVVCTKSQEWHIAFDYKFMGRWVLISTAGKLIERSEVEFSQNCDSLREF